MGSDVPACAPMLRGQVHLSAERCGGEAGGRRPERGLGQLLLTPRHAGSRIHRALGLAKWPSEHQKVEGWLQNAAFRIGQAEAGIRPTDAQRRARPERTWAFPRTTNRSSARSERVRGRGGREEGQPCFLPSWREERLRGQKRRARTFGQKQGPKNPVSRLSHDRSALSAPRRTSTYARRRKV